MIQSSLFSKSISIFEEAANNGGEIFASGVQFCGGTELISESKKKNIQVTHIHSAPSILFWLFRIEIMIFVEP